MRFVTISDYGRVIGDACILTAQRNMINVQQTNLVLNTQHACPSLLVVQCVCVHVACARRWVCVACLCLYVAVGAHGHAFLLHAWGASTCTSFSGLSSEVHFSGGTHQHADEPILYCLEDWLRPPALRDNQESRGVIHNKRAVK